MRTAQLGRDIKAAKTLRLPWWGVLCLIIGSLPIYWLFDHFGRLNTALPTLNILAVFGFIIAVKWKLRRQAWFWGTMTFLASLHVPLLLFVPWTSKWIPAIIIGAIDSADFCVMLVIVSVVENFVKRQSNLRKKSALCNES
jgi:hypothetical protein